MQMETLRKCSILFEVREGEDFALLLHCVRPQEYYEYFEEQNLSLTQTLGKRAHFTGVSY